MDVPREQSLEEKSEKTGGPVEKIEGDLQAPAVEQTADARTTSSSSNLRRNIQSYKTPMELLAINAATFDYGLEQRLNTNIDLSHVEALGDSIGVKPTILNDMSGVDLKNSLKSYVKEKNFREVGLIVCIVSAHSNSDEEIFMRDSLFLEKDLLLPIAKAATFQNSHLLVLGQYCRGHESPKKKKQKCEPVSGTSQSTLSDLSEDFDQLMNTKQNCITFYRTTVHGQPAYRCKARGSLLLEVVCDSLKKWKGAESLMQLLTKCSGRISTMCNSIMTPEIESNHGISVFNCAAAEFVTCKPRLIDVYNQENDNYALVIMSRQSTVKQQELTVHLKRWYRVSEIVHPGESELTRSVLLWCNKASRRITPSSILVFYLANSTMQTQHIMQQIRSAFEACCLDGTPKTAIILQEKRAPLQLKELPCEKSTATTSGSEVDLELTTVCCMSEVSGVSSNFEEAETPEADIMAVVIQAQDVQQLAAILLGHQVISPEEAMRAFDLLKYIHVLIELTRNDINKPAVLISTLRKAISINAKKKESHQSLKYHVQRDGNPSKTTTSTEALEPEEDVMESTSTSPTIAATSISSEEIETVYTSPSSSSESSQDDVVLCNPTSSISSVIISQSSIPGLCMIFNWTTFDARLKLRPRLSSTRSAMKLKLCLEKHKKFQVIYHENKTKEEFITCVNDGLKLVEENGFGMLVLVVSSHGDEGLFFCYNKHIKCSHLKLLLLENQGWKDTPKLVIFAACRGAATEQQYQLEAMPSVSFNTLKFNRILRSGEPSLMVLSTSIPGHVSYTFEDWGVYILRDLASSLKDWHAQPMSDMMQEILGGVVALKIDEEKTSPHPIVISVTGEYQCFTSKEIFFGPGKHKVAEIGTYPTSALNQRGRGLVLLPENASMEPQELARVLQNVVNLDVKIEKHENTIESIKHSIHVFTKSTQREHPTVVVVVFVTPQVPCNKESLGHDLRECLGVAHNEAVGGKPKLLIICHADIQEIIAIFTQTVPVHSTDEEEIFEGGWNKDHDLDFEEVHQCTNHSDVLILELHGKVGVECLVQQLNKLGKYKSHMMAWARTVLQKIHSRCKAENLYPIEPPSFTSTLQLAFVLPFPST